MTLVDAINESVDTGKMIGVDYTSDTYDTLVELIKSGTISITDLSITGCDNQGFWWGVRLEKK